MGTQRLQSRFMQKSVEAVVSFVERERKELQSASSIVQLRQKASLKKPGLRVAGVDREGRLRPIEGLQALLAIALLQQSPPEHDPGIGVPESPQLFERLLLTA